MSPSPWVLPDVAIEAIEARLEELRPGLVLEAGSGRSTAVLARHAAHVVTLEHLPQHAARTRRTLDGATNVDLRCVDLAMLKTPAGLARWYDTELPDGIEWALVDGPPAYTGGRLAALFAIAPHLAPGAEVWLDDAERPGEQAALAAWGAHLFARVASVPGVPRLAVVTVP